ALATSRMPEFACPELAWTELASRNSGSVSSTSRSRWLASAAHWDWAVPLARPADSDADSLRCTTRSFWLESSTHLLSVPDMVPPGCPRQAIAPAAPPDTHSLDTSTERFG